MDKKPERVATDLLQTSFQDDSQAILRDTFEQLPIAILVTDTAGRLVGYNKTAGDLLGEIPLNIPPGEWPTRFGLYREDGKTLFPSVDLPIHRALNGETISGEEMIHRSNRVSEAKWICVSAKPLLAPEGMIYGALLLIADITSRKQAELIRDKKIRKAEALYVFSRQISKYGNDPIKILKAVTEFTSKIIGDASSAALLNQPGDRLKVFAFHHPKRIARELIQRSLTSQDYPYESNIEGLIRTGKPILLPTLDQVHYRENALPEQLPYLDEIGISSLLVVPIKGRFGILGTLSLSRDRGGKPYTAEDQTYVMDIAYRVGLAIDNNALVHSLRRESSGRRTAEKALVHSEVRFQSIFTSTALGIKILDLVGNILEVNPSFYQMLGYSQEELKGTPISAYLHPKDANRFQKLLDNLVNGVVNSFQLEHRLISKAGSTVWVNATITGIKENEQDRSFAYIVAIAEDITHRKQIEAEMTLMKSRLNSHVEMERLQLAQDLHDGPMQDLYSVIYKIDNWVKKTDPGSREKLESMRQDMLNVISELRNTAKDLRPPALANFGLEKAIRSHADDFSENHSELDIRLSLAPDKQFLPEDIRLTLFRIYQHSLANVLRHARASQVFVHFAFDAEEAQLEIKDNGIGFIVPDNWVGLVRQGHFGLAGEVERVTLMEGKFTIDSSPGHGTTVRVVIPIKESTDPTNVGKED